MMALAKVKIGSSLPRLETCLNLLTFQLTQEFYKKKHYIRSGILQYYNQIQLKVYIQMQVQLFENYTNQGYLNKNCLKPKFNRQVDLQEQSQNQIREKCLNLIYEQKLQYKYFVQLKQNMNKHRETSIFCDIELKKRQFLIKFKIFGALKTVMAQKHKQIQNQTISQKFYLKTMFKSFQKITNQQFSLRLKRLNLKQHLTKNRIKNLIQIFSKQTQNSVVINNNKQSSELKQNQLQISKTANVLYSQKSSWLSIASTKLKLSQIIFKKNILRKYFRNLKVQGQYCIKNEIVDKLVQHRFKRPQEFSENISEKICNQQSIA